MTDTTAIPFPSLLETLEESLRAAVIQPNLKSDNKNAPFTPRRDNSYIDIEIAVNQFKLRWIYSDKSTYSLDPSYACGSHYALFVNNLSVTDIVDAEFLSLLRMHSHLRSDTTRQEPPHASFLSDIQYSLYVASLLKSTLRPELPKDMEAYIKHVAAEIDRHHGIVLRDTVSIDRFFTSALIHIPRTLAINMQLVVAESGYIHSVGYSVYARRAEKAEKFDLEQNLRQFLEARPSAKKLYFTPFAREYFEPYQGKSARISMKNGLDGVQFDLRKQHIGGQPVQDIIPDLERDFSADIYFASGKMDFDVEREASGADPSYSLFMLYDQRPVPTAEESYAKSISNYLILYAQYMLNGSQLISFEERKPAWPGPITLPHTLSASMLNIVSGTIRESTKKSLLVVDPFCGTGTSLIDAAVRFPNARIVGIDRNPAMPALVRDNLEFFALPRSRILEITAHIDRLVHGMPRRMAALAAGRGFKPFLPSTSPTLPKIMDYEKDFDRALEICGHEAFDSMGQIQDSRGGRSMQEVLEGGFNTNTCAFLNDSGSSLDSRLIFYLTWRSLVNGRNQIRQNPEHLFQIVLDEMQRFRSEINLLSLKDESFIGEAGAYSFYQGIFSPQSVVKRARMVELSESLSEDSRGSSGEELGRPGRITLISADSLDVLRQNVGKIDVLIGDPPYWFNTDSADIDMAQTFYAEFVKAAVTSLSGGGQMIIPVLQYSRNGRQVPFFQTRGALVRQVFAVAESLGRRIISVSHAIPGGVVKSSPPFYWNSTAVLSRKILWFTID